MNSLLQALHICNVLLDAEKLIEAGKRKARHSETRWVANAEKLTVPKDTNMFLLVAHHSTIHVPRSSGLTIFLADGHSTVTYDRGAKVTVLIRGNCDVTEHCCEKTNCTRCGGPLPSDGTCEYCGCNH